MKKLNLIYISIMLVFISGLAGCGEDGVPGPVEISLTDSQLAAVSMRGTWGQASEVTLPPGTTEGVLDKLSLKFSITDEYEPDAFEGVGEIAMDYLFKPGSGKWKWVDGSITQIQLIGVSPVTLIDIKDEGQSIRLSFTYNGEEGDGGRVSAVGQYGVTLKKVAP